MVKLSVIVPIFGVEKYLRNALDSILNQTLQEIEIILIDDGGKDNCPQIIDEYANKDNRIIAIHKPNGGYGQSCNIGLEKAIGKYVAIMEPDDFIVPEMYEDLFNIAEKYDSDVVKSCFYNKFVSENNKSFIIKEDWSSAKIPSDRSFQISEHPELLDFHPSIWSCIFKREFLNENNIRFQEIKGAGWSDNLFQVKTMCLAKRINYTPNAYYYWTRRDLDKLGELKDYKLPFERCDEIDLWLEENNIFDKGIVNNLHRRELAYIPVVLAIRNITDIDDCYKRIAKTIEKIEKSDLQSYFKLRTQEKFILKYGKSNPQKLRRNFLFKRFRKKLLRILIPKIYF